MAQPHTPSTRWGDEKSSLSQLVTDPSLAVSRVIQGVGQHRRFRTLIGAILQIRAMPVLTLVAPAGQPIPPPTCIDRNVSRDNPIIWHAYKGR